MALAASRGDGDQLWDPRLVKAGRGGVARSDIGGGARSFGPLGGSRLRPQAAFNAGAHTWQRRGGHAASVPRQVAPVEETINDKWAIEFDFSNLQISC
jgi:hypothetical protein